MGQFEPHLPCRCVGRQRKGGPTLPADGLLNNTAQIWFSTLERDRFALDKGKSGAHIVAAWIVCFPMGTDNPMQPAAHERRISPPIERAGLNPSMILQKVFTRNSIADHETSIASKSVVRTTHDNLMKGQVQKFALTGQALFQEMPPSS